MPTTHQTHYLRTGGPFAILLQQHGESVTIDGTAYTVTFAEREEVDMNGNTLRVSTLRGVDSTLPAITEKTPVTRSLDSTVWRARGPGRVRSGVRLVELVTWTNTRTGGFG